MVCVTGLHVHPHIRLLKKRTHSTQPIVIFTNRFYCSLRIQTNICKGKRFMGQRLEETGASFQESSPHWLTELHRMNVIPSAICGDNTCAMFAPGKLIRDSAPTVFIGGWSCRPFCLTYTKIPDIRRKADVQHKPHYLCQNFRHSEPLLLGWWELSRNFSSQMSA